MRNAAVGRTAVGLLSGPLSRGKLASGRSEFEEPGSIPPIGTRLHGWYVPHEHPRAVILLAHGNAGNVTHRADLLRDLHDQMRTSVLCFDYRGYGRSEGTPDEQGVLADARAARAWLAARAGIPERQIVMMGESLGGGVAVDLAAADGARGLVLKSTFSSIRDVAAADFPCSPVRPLVQIRFDSAAKIPNYHGPLLQFHGDNDHTIPLASARRLFAAANEPKRLRHHPRRRPQRPTDAGILRGAERIS